MTATLRDLREPTRVLLVLDRPVLAAVLALALTHGRYVTWVARTGAATVAALRDWGPHLAVVDMDLARDTILERLADALPPADRPPVVALTPVLRLGALEIDILNRRVMAGGRELHLTALEQSLLYLLAANAGRLLTRDEILDYLWGADHAAESNVVDRHVRNLRIKLADDWQRPRYIATVPGQGYRFLPTAADDASPDAAPPAAN